MKRKWSGKWRCWDSNYDGEAIPRKRFRSIVRHATGVFVTISPSCTLLNASISSESLFRAALLPRSGERPNRGGKQKGTRRHWAMEKAETRERFIKRPPHKKIHGISPAMLWATSQSADREKKRADPPDVCLAIERRVRSTSGVQKCSQRLEPVRIQSHLSQTTT